MILLIDACLTPAAMVNAVITATEVKTQVLMAHGVRTPEGYAATGTSTDTLRWPVPVVARLCRMPAR